MKGPAHHPRRRRNGPMLARYDPTVQSRAPSLVIVSGAPGGGKTTLARRLSSDLRLPLLSRDELQEALADAMGWPSDVPGSMRLGAGSYAVLYRTLAALLEAGSGAVVDSNFKRGVSEPELRPLIAWGTACLVHCTADPATLQARYTDRFARGERHPAHLDGDRAVGLAEDLAAGRYEPLNLPIPTLVVDTEDGWRPSYEEVRDFAALPEAALRW
jgi:predicted kinase